VQIVERRENNKEITTIEDLEDNNYDRDISLSFIFI
jgi:hypothetical protein